jgi:NAD(P)-dependent dehydrogenase (short-subunit alcohol dehydrogenase family)
VELKPLEEQVVVVVGASSGIGRETAVRMAGRGARVVASARSQAGLDDLVDEITLGGGTAIAVAADVVDAAAMRALADAAVERFGTLDTWVHAAAVTAFATFVDTTPEEFRQIVEVNLVGAANGASAALPRLREGGGALVVVSSMEARRAMPLHSAYAASKHGIDGMLEALRVELAHDGIPVSVTNILPGVIDTPLFDQARSKVGVVPTGPPPPYDPGLVADAICFAAEHPARDLVVGGAAQAQLIGQRLSPRMMDLVTLVAGFATQRTDEPKGVEAPDNVDRPLEDVRSARGHFGRTRSTSAWTRFDIRRQRPIEAAYAALAGVAAPLGRRLAKDGAGSG